MTTLKVLSTCPPTCQRCFLHMSKNHKTSLITWQNMPGLAFSARILRLRIIRRKIPALSLWWLKWKKTLSSCSSKIPCGKFLVKSKHSKRVKSYKQTKSTILKMAMSKLKFMSVISYFQQFSQKWLKAEALLNSYSQNGWWRSTRNSAETLRKGQRCLSKALSF